MSIIKPFVPWEAKDPFGAALYREEEFSLQQWPIKLWKVPDTSPYFHHAHLLLAADCVGFSYAKLHEKLTPGRIPLICCPENDFEITAKLADILRLNDIQSVTVVRMDAPCCAELTELALQAVKLSKKAVPLRTTTIFVDCEIVD